MNQQGNVFFGTLGGKLLLAFLVAVLLPLALLGALSFSSATSITRQNVEAYLLESGQRRLQAITSAYEQAVERFQQFAQAEDNAVLLSNPLVIRQERGTALGTEQYDQAINEALAAYFQRPPASFNSLWLQPNQVSEINNALQAVPGSANKELVGISSFQQRVAERVIQSGRRLQEGDIRLLSVLVGGDTPHVLLISPIYGIVNAQDTLVGYLVGEVNTERVFFQHLQEQFGAIPVNAYMILPDTAAILAPDENTAQASNTSLGAQNLLNDLTTDPFLEVYQIPLSDESTLEVLGYYTTVPNPVQPLPFILEVETSLFSQQLLDHASGIGFPLVIGSLVLVLIIVQLMNQMITLPVRQLQHAAREMIRGNFQAPVTSTGQQDEIGELASTFVDLREEIRRLTEDMEQRLRARTRDVNVIQEIGRTITQERDLDVLLSQAVQMIVDNFPTIYHAQVFLLDKEREFAVLRASTGRAGQELLQRGHKLAVGSISVIGQVTEQGETITARDITESAVHRRNEFLPETRAELAIPLRYGQRVIGALDVQSKRRDSFDDDLINALQTLADQMTIAIENALLFEEEARLIANLEKSQRAETRQAWEDYLKARRRTAMRSQFGTKTEYDFAPLSAAAYTHGRYIVGERTDQDTIPFAVPIILRGETLGVVEYEVPRSDFSLNKVQLAEELVNRLVVSLENARLFQDSQTAADRERIVNEISAKLTEQRDIQAIIETAIREVSLALRTPQVAIRLTPQNGAPQRNGNGSLPAPPSSPYPTSEPPEQES